MGKIWNTILFLYLLDWHLRRRRKKSNSVNCSLIRFHSIIQVELNKYILYSELGRIHVDDENKKFKCSFLFIRNITTTKFVCLEMVLLIRWVRQQILERIDSNSIPVLEFFWKKTCKEL